MRTNIDAYAASLRAAGRSEGTIYQRTYWPRRLAADTNLPADQWTTDTVTTWAARQSWKRDTRRAAFISLTQYAQWAGIPIDIPQSPRPSPPAPRPIPEAAYRRALAAAPPREALAIRLAGEAGLRVSETAAVNVAHLEPDLLGLSLRVHGKGERTRLVPLSDALAEAIRTASDEDGWAFPNGKGSHFTGNALARKCRPYLDGYGFHALRHRYATICYEGSRDVLAVQKLLGHASPATTQRYVATSASYLRSVALKAA